MTKATVTMVVCAQLLWAGTVLAVPTAQQNCNRRRVAVWNAFRACVEGTAAKQAGGASFNVPAAFAKCRHSYFKKWGALQLVASIAGSTCIGSRFTDNGDGTVTDNLSDLIWEKKTNLDSTPNVGDPEDADNDYTWSAGPPFKGSGTVFTSFLATVNGGGSFAGANNWRVATLAELQTIVLDYPCGAGSPTCSCGSSPCIESALGPTAPNVYWSSTAYVPDSSHAWCVSFQNGDPADVAKGSSASVRAVRGGL